MRRLGILVSVLAVVAMALFALPTNSATRAQEPEHEEEARSPLTGGWVVTSPDTPNAPPALWTFTAEGNLLQTGPRGVSSGVWEAQGDDAAEFVLVLFVLDAQGRYIRETARGVLRLEGGADTWTAVYILVGTDPDGNEMFHDEGTWGGERITIEATPSAATPTS